MSSVIAGTGGSFVTNLSDGTVYGDDPGYDLMHLAKAQNAGSGEWLGTSLGGALVKQIGVPALRHVTEWSQAQGDQGGANAASVDCGDNELNDLLTEYRDPTRFRPKCEEFTKDGAGSRYFSWADLSGYVADDPTANNTHPYAIVPETLRSGVDATEENYEGEIRITAAYRCPHRNAAITEKAPESKNSLHILGLAADLKPKEAPAGPLERTTWDKLAEAALAAGAVKIEEWDDARPETQDHVHASFGTRPRT